MKIWKSVFGLLRSKQGEDLWALPNSYGEEWFFRVSPSPEHKMVGKIPLTFTVFQEHRFKIVKSLALAKRA